MLLQRQAMLLVCLLHGACAVWSGPLSYTPYKVQEGDTLTSIAAKMSVQRSSISEINAISAVYAGQMLLIPDERAGHPIIQTMFQMNEPYGHARSNTSLETNLRSPPVLLLVMILSVPKNIEERIAIRNTWMKWANHRVTYRFVIGTKGLSEEMMLALSKERTQFQDLVLLGSTADQYELLTSKVLASMQWACENLQFKFVMKTDDNAFVRLDKLVEEVSIAPTERLYWGYFHGSQPVLREGKWADLQWDRCETFLPYALGGGYILSYDLAAYVAANADKLKKYFNEDSTMGLWLGPLKVNRKHDMRFDTNSPNRGCMNDDIVIKKQSPSDMFDKYQRLLTAQPLCHEEFEDQIPHTYEFHRPVGECCKQLNRNPLKPLLPTSSVPVTLPSDKEGMNGMHPGVIQPEHEIGFGSNPGLANHAGPDALQPEVLQS